MKNFLSLFLLMPFVLQAQSVSDSCYAEYRAKGIGYMQGKNKDYGEAISQFVAALVTCKHVPADNDLSRLIEESKRKWAGDLQASVTEARKAFDDANAAKDAAISAKTAEIEARKKAEENAEKAYKRGIRAESFRLALLADMARQQGHKTDALLLSWMGLQLSDTVQPYVMRSFGEAVRDTFTVPFFSSPATIQSVQYLPGGQHVLIQTAAPAFFLVHLGEPVGVTQMPAQLLHVAVSPLGDRLLAWGNSTNVLIINMDGKTEATLTGHSENVRSAVFSPDGQQILTTSRDNSSKLWDLSGRLLTTLEGHTGNVQSGAFSPDATRLLTRSSDGSAKVWDEKGRNLYTIRDSVNFVLRACFSSNNAVFVQLSNNTLHIWQANGLLAPAPGTGSVRSFQPAPDAKFMAAQAGSKNILLYNADGQLAATLAHGNDLKGFCFASDSKHLISWTSDHVLHLWNMQGKLLQEFNGHRKNVLSADYRTDKGLLLTTSADGPSKLWDKEGNMVTEWNTGAKDPAPAIFSPSGGQIVSIGEGGKSASLSPLPQDIYAKADRAALLKSAPLNMVKKTYDIQFLEALELKK